MQKQEQEKDKSEPKVHEGLIDMEKYKESILNETDPFEAEL